MKDKVLQGQAAVKNGAVVEANSYVVDLAAFNTKAAISAALQYVKNVELFTDQVPPLMGLPGGFRRLAV